MGEGIIYESMNMASLYKLPVLFVCENNRYAQSTKIENNLAGSIKKRAESFNLKVYSENTFNYSSLKNSAAEIIKNVRDGQPSFVELDTYRLKAHSKGDDDRDNEEIEYFKKGCINSVDQK